MYVFTVHHTISPDTQCHESSSSSFRNQQITTGHTVMETKSSTVNPFVPSATHNNKYIVSKAYEFNQKASVSAVLPARLQQRQMIWVHLAKNYSYAILLKHRKHELQCVMRSMRSNFLQTWKMPQPFTLLNNL